MGKVIYLYEKNGGNGMYDENDEKNIVEVVKLILYFANNTTTKLYKTKLNKLLFYVQFLYYKTFKERLIKDDFICDYHGPTIPDLDYYLNSFEQLGFIELDTTNYGTVIYPKQKLAKDDYTDNERDVLKKVLKTFDKVTATEISDYSHKETLWSNTALKEIISVERANELNDLRI